MVDFLAAAAIVLAGLYLVVLGVSCYVQPSTAAKFLLGFASSSFLHYLELALRVLVGGSLVHKASSLPYPPIFNLFGWVLIITSVAMFVVPWRWHRRFALKAVPYALRYIKLLGAGAMAFGAVLVASVFVASTS